MANDISLTDKNFQEIFRAFGFYYPENLIYRKKDTRSFSPGESYWHDRGRFIAFISGITQIPIKDENDIVHIKQAQIELARIQSEKKANIEGKTEAVNQNIAASTPDKYLREQQAEILKQQEEALKTSTEAAKASTRSAIDRKKQIYEEQIRRAQEFQKRHAKDNLYVSAKTEALTTEERATRDKFVEQVKADPDPVKNTVPLIVNDIKSRTGSEIPDAAIQLTATYIVANAINDSRPAVEAALAQKIRDLPQFKDIGDDLADQRRSMHELAKIVAARAYGDGSKILVPDIKAEVSETPHTGFTPLPSAYFAARNEEVLKRQNEALNSSPDKKEAFMVSELDRQLAMIRTGAIQGAKVNYRESLVQGYLLTFKPQSQPSWTASGGPEKLEFATNTTNFNFIQSVTGIATRAVTNQITKQITKQGAVKAVVSLLGKLGATETGGLSILAAQAVGWLADHIDLNKIKKYSAIVIASLTTLIALPFVGLGSALLIGGSTGLLSAAFGAGVGGLTAAGLGSGILNFFGALGSATLGAIGIPILFTLLGFPVVVALILFIINSGAYVVPPGAGLGSSGAHCNIGATGSPSPQSTDPAVNAAECILLYLDKEGINPLLAGNSNGSAWKSFVADLANKATSDRLQLSASTQSGLQCSGYVSAVAIYAYGVNFPYVNACMYTSDIARSAGYKYVSGTGGIKVGDFFVMGSNSCIQCGTQNAPVGSCGHIGVVCGVAGVKITACDANAKILGQVRDNGVFVTSDISGYLRKQ